MVIARYIIAAVWLAYLAVWAVAIVVLVLLVIMLVVSRGPVAVLRRLFRRGVVAGAGSGSVHAAAQHVPSSQVAAGIRSLRAADPGFDATAFLDGTRMAVGAYAMAIASQDDRLLRRITTPRYWQTPNGKAVADSIAQWQRYAGVRSGTTNQGRVLLDVSWRQPEVTEVALGEQGMDRITVRLGSVMIGVIRQGWRRLEAATLLDWDFVRPAGQRTDPAAILLPRTCYRCGGPYRSDLDEACPFCHAPRPDTQAGWRLDCTYQVVDA